MLNESELIELQRIADKAAEKTRHPDDCDCMAQFNRKFKPTTCAELVREVLELRERWNTRFNTLCGLCGKRYRGPRDEHLHGTGVCGGQP